MTNAVKVTTNNVPRVVIDAWELTAKEREDFDYVDWAGVEDGTSGASFFRYRGELYDLGEFERATPAVPGWDGMQSDSHFSGIVVRYANESCETVVVGTYSC